NQTSSLNLARQQLYMIEERISVGASAPLDRAQALTQIATSETNLLTSTQYVTTTENALKQLILRDPGAAAWSARVVPTDRPSLAAIPIDLPAALTDAFANRPELNRLRLQREINDIDVQFFRNQTLPRFDAQATVSSAGFAGTPLSLPIFSGNQTNSSSAFLFDQVNQLRAALGLPAVPVPPATSSV